LIIKLLRADGTSLHYFNNPEVVSEPSHKLLFIFFKIYSIGFTPSQKGWHASWAWCSSRVPGSTLILHFRHTDTLASSV